jgi:DNA (cytosine-5)-methyltransferase 1
MKFYTIEEIADSCKLSQKIIRRQIAAGILIANRSGNQYQIHETDFKKWLSGSTCQQAMGDKIQYTLFGGPIIESTRSKFLDRKSDDINWIDISQDWENKKYNPAFSYIDLFSGAGGLSLGFEQAGFEGIAAVENMPAAIETYVRNFHHPVISDDITKDKTKKDLYSIINKSEFDEIDVICGGFPCQGFSMSGHRIVDDNRNSLYKEMLEIVHHIKPKYIVMENVTGLRSMLNGKVEEKIIADYKNIGYKINVTVLNSADYYVPQLRKRVIFIGNRLSNINYHPKPLLSEKNYLTTKSSIEDLMNRSEDIEFNHVPTKHSLEMEKRLRAVPEGGALYKNYSDAWKKCPWDSPSCTIKENHGGVNIHPKLPRVLTAREMARLQSFPDNFIFKGSKKWQLVQIGNAVPPLLAKAIALAVRRSLTSAK